MNTNRKPYKKILNVTLCFFTIISMTACNSTSEDDSSYEQPVTYEIGICTDDSSDYSNLVVTGYKDALIDRFGEDSLIFAEQNASTAPSAPTAVETVLQAGVDDLFVCGTKCLSASTELSSNTPVIFSGVYNYEDVLHIVSDNNENPPLNVTGISSKSPTDEQVSLLIEATDNHPHAVGIPYDPTDTLAIVQNEEFETYLDEAGIPWKEYEIAAYDDAADNSSTSGDVSADDFSLPTLSSQASGKEGSNIDVDSIGNVGDLTGINEPLSARSPKLSALWQQNAPADSNPDEPENNPTASLDDTSSLELAFAECDSIYLCPDNNLCSSKHFMQDIKQLAIDTQTATIGGNEIIGKNTLVSLYDDPYDIGYRCGKKSISILTKEKDVSEIPIDAPLRSKVTKLYNAEISAKLNKEWYKSFHEHDEYLRDYEPGSLTERIEAEE